ncbi:MAG: AI-2E family transporter [Pseudomonadota bacterium]
MTLTTKSLVWVGLLIVILLTIYVLSPILLPFVLAFFLAYVLNPLVAMLEKAELSRSFGSAAVVVFFTVILVSLLLLLVPILLVQIQNFAATLPEQASKVGAAIESLVIRVFGPDAAQVEDAVLQRIRDGLTFQEDGVSQAITSLITGGLAVVNFLSLVLITPVLTFYLLADWPRLMRGLHDHIPLDYKETVERLLGEIDQVISGFLRGQGLVALLLGLIYATGLVMVGLTYGLLIGLVAGLLSYIPFVGTIIGFVLGMFAAISQFWPEWLPIVLVAVVFGVGQVLEGNFLSPKIVGDRIKLHPVWLIFSLFAFSYLFGVVGLLIAVPVAAVIGVLGRFALAEYRDSALYRASGSQD